jgi:hypothetical protein
MPQPPWTFSYRTHLTDVFPPTPLCESQKIHNNPRTIVLLEDYGMKHGLLNETDRTWYKNYKTLVPESGHAFVYFRLLRKVRKERFWESNYDSAREEFAEDIATLSKQQPYPPLIIARGPESSWITLLYEMEDPKPLPLAGIVMLDPLEIDLNDDDEELLECARKLIEMKRKKREKLRNYIKLGKIKPEEDRYNFAGFDPDLDMDLQFWKVKSDSVDRPPPCPKFIVSSRWDKKIVTDSIGTVGDDFRFHAQIIGKRFGLSPETPLPILKMEPEDVNYGHNLLQTVCQWIQDPQYIQSLALPYDEEKRSESNSIWDRKRLTRPAKIPKSASAPSSDKENSITWDIERPTEPAKTPQSASGTSTSTSGNPKRATKTPLMKRKTKKQKLRTRIKQSSSSILGNPEDLL